MDAAEGEMISDAEEAEDPERVEQVVRWLLDGNRESDIIESILAAWPGQVPQPGKLIDAACRRLNESANIPRGTVLGWAFEATMLVYQKSMAIGDLAGALRAVKQIADFADKFGMDEPTGKEGAT